MRLVPPLLVGAVVVLLPVEALVTWFAVMALTRGQLTDGVMGGLVALAVAVCLALVVYPVIFAPRLALDAEGITITTFGIDRQSIHLQWSQLASVHLGAVNDRAGNQLYLSLKTTSSYGDSGRQSSRRRFTCELGRAGYNRVNRALTSYCGCEYTTERN